MIEKENYMDNFETLEKFIRHEMKGTRKAKVITDDEGRNRIFSNSRSR